MKSKRGPAPQPNEVFPQPSLAAAVERCRGTAGFIPHLRRIYAGVGRAIARRGATCRACGRCCRFSLVDHRLYVSTGELALLSDRPPGKAVRPGRCPYQHGRLCAARGRRPLGCRAFFCDDGLRDFSHELYEKWHARIRRLHDTHRIPYHYIELVAGLSRIV
jgi:Fe-S-cluster containining protein